MTIRPWMFMVASSLAPYAASAGMVVPMHSVDDKGVEAVVGWIAVSESPYGVVFTPDLKGLTPGLHGFHVHQNPDCGPKEKDGKPVAALAAGGHFDPGKTGRHDTPWGDGHLGDLPPLYVNANGNATEQVLAPRLKMSDLKHRSLMIHAGGDNFSDYPAPVGGGGARIVCGVTP
ncbi:MAG: superoxide dismutase [Cu-Zn] SodC [Betaproteobacteria bacterium]|nr:superoxide dismutase [Cu-Zn] SodC [Betaproteobacteria bacterium]